MRCFSYLLHHGCCFLELPILLLGLLVDSNLVFELSHVDILVAAIILCRLFTFFITTQEETNTANNDLFIL